MALAGLCRQVLHAALWLPDSDTFLADALNIHGMAQANHATLTSVSVGQEQLLARLAAASSAGGTAAGTVVALSDAAVGQPPAFGAVLVGSAADLDLSGQALVAYRDAWSQQTLLPVRETPLGGATAAVRLHPWIPDGLDAHRHEWMVDVGAVGQVVSPHLVSRGRALLAEESPEFETPVGAAGGGITFGSHRMNWVDGGASALDRLAAPTLNWPAELDLLTQAAQASGYEILPSPAGRRASVAQRLMGSRAEVEAFAAGPGWLVAKAFNVSKRNTPRPEHVLALHNGARRYLSSAAISGLPIPGWTWADRAALTDEWTAQGVLRRGLVLGCAHCPTVEFYPLVEVTQVYVCRRCGGANTLIQRRWVTARQVASATPVEEGPPYADAGRRSGLVL